jgi:histidinol phosphatase-like PHP family hydrolase
MAGQGKKQQSMKTPTNADLAELCLQAADQESGHRQAALRRAGRAAVMSWPMEAAELAAAPGRSLTELQAVGPWLARRILTWLERPPEPPDPPELRRGFLTLARATAIVEANPEWTAALRGDLQMHTTYSDGKATVREMAERCADLGYEFVAITDHSRTLRIARGMDEGRLAAEGLEIEAVNQELAREARTLRLLRGIEMDLDAEGKGDMDPAALAGLDIVLGAFHSGLRLESDQTERYVAALRNPEVCILAHPRARKYDRRRGLRADWDRVVQTAAGSGTALEIDAYPDRQDLDVDLLELARDAGAWISIGTDAHSVGELRFMEFGIAAAILAGIPRERILNFLSPGDVVAWAGSLRDRA